MALAPVADRIAEIREVIHTVATGGVVAYSAFGRSVTRMDLKQLREYLRELLAEQAADLGGADNRIYAGFADEDE